MGHVHKFHSTIDQWFRQVKKQVNIRNFYRSLHHLDLDLVQRGECKMEDRCLIMVLVIKSFSKLSYQTNVFYHRRHHHYHHHHCLYV